MTLTAFGRTLGFGAAENSKRLISISESLLDMNEIECDRCGWNWIMYEGEAEADCPFCPKTLGVCTFTTTQQSEQRSSSGFECPGCLLN